MLNYVIYVKRDAAIRHWIQAQYADPTQSRDSFGSAAGEGAALAVCVFRLNRFSRKCGLIQDSGIRFIGGTNRVEY